ncbi:MAG: GtrA family protein [Patescibacteria group bacterium]
MNRKDYFLAIVAGVFTGFFVFFIFKHVDIEIPGGMISLLAGIPALWILGLNLARILAKYFSWSNQFGRFIVVGFLNASIDFGILNFLSFKTGIYSGKPIILFNVLAFTVAVTNSYLWNKYWTFKSEGKPRVSEAAKFVSVNLIGVVINTGIVYSVITFADLVNGFSPPEVENIAKVIATAISLFWSFFGLKFLVFKK